MATLAQKLHNLIASLNTAVAKGDAKAVAKWAGKIALAADPVVPKFVVNAPAIEVPDSYFVSGASDAVLIVGGSPDNPDGVTFTFGQAVDWWRIVFAQELNIGSVRASLTPGSKVLSAEGLAAARALGVESTDYAPADFNPLGLPVIA